MNEIRLPLPIACLRRRSQNSRSKNPKDAHDSALFAWEASLRLAVALRPPAELAALKRASFGEWARALSLPDLALDDARLLELFELGARVGRGEAGSRRSIRPRELLDVLAAYRNKAHGHALQQTSFYRDAGPVLLEALEAAWQTELFLPRAGVLVYVEKVEREAQGAFRGHVLELEGEHPFKSAPLGLAVPANVLPHQIYWREGERWRSLHPWLAYDEDTLRVAFFDKLDRRAHFLDFVSGSPPREELLALWEPAVFALFEEHAARGATRTAEDEVERAVDPRAFGEFSILGRLGAGGMGEVFLARQASLDRLVALKMLPPSVATDPLARARFAREIDALSRCEHPHVVKILTSGTTRGTPWYAMEYVEGADLALVARALSESKDFDTAVSTACATVRKERSELFPDAPLVERAPLASTKSRPRWPELARFFRDAALGVQHLHERGVLHRDLKPGNLMVTTVDHRAVVMDLGLAAVESATVSLSHDRGKLLGTLRYMAPEQLQRSLRQVDARADVYGLGATLYELLTDRPLFDGESEQRLIKQVLDEEPAAPRSYAPDLPRDLELVVRTAIAKDPAERYASAAAFAADLDAVLDGRPVAARGRSFGYLLWKQIRRRKELSAAIAFLILGAVGFAVVHTQRLREEVAAKAIEIEALRAGSTIDSLRLEAEQRLWPMRSETIPALRAWLAKAEELRLQIDAARRRGVELAVEVETLRSFFEGPSEMAPEIGGALGTSVPEVRRRLELTERWLAMTKTSEEAQREWREAGMEPIEHLLPLSRNPQGLWEFWHVPSGERPKLIEPQPEREDANRWQITREMGMVYVLLPGGTHWHGAQKGDPSKPNYYPKASSDEGPVLKFPMSPFLISKYEITVAQWARLAGEDRDWPATNLPRHHLSWFHCALTERRIGSACMPTEIEWEYACRAGTTTPWWTGADESDLGSAARFNGSKRNPSAGTLRANDWGLHDVHGSLFEWCLDDAESRYGYVVEDRGRAGAQIQSLEAPMTRVERRTVRGGCSASSASECRSAHRFSYPPAGVFEYVGLRPVLPAQLHQ
ncbi:MAG: protein kinase [Planctomycetes bacterium]|nr:protein kinase [Planctomycetota bacterium]